MTTKRHRKKIARELPPVGTTLDGRFKGEARTACGVAKPHPYLSRSLCEAKSTTDPRPAISDSLLARQRGENRS
jgi:hypothetical protein